MIYHRHRKASRNSIHRPTPDTDNRRTTSIEEGCNLLHYPSPVVVHRPNPEIVHHPKPEGVHHSNPEIFEFPDLESVHPAHRGSTYKGPKTRGIDASTTTAWPERAEPYYEGEGMAAAPVVEMGLSKGNALRRKTVHPST